MNNKFSFTTDIVLFSVDNRENNDTRKLSNKYFRILLVKRDKEPFKNMYVLPGGFVSETESSEVASKRILKKETNIDNIYLSKLKVFDDINRDPRSRTISSSYIALIDKNKLNNELSEDSKWFDICYKELNNKICLELINEDTCLKAQLIKKIKDVSSGEYTYEIINSDLGFDHALIINEGIIELRKRIKDTDIVFNLMPKEFTIGELKQIYELILDKKLINSAFRRVIAKKIEMTDTKIKNGGHRPSILFKYKNKK